MYKTDWYTMTFFEKKEFTPPNDLMGEQWDMHPNLAQKFNTFRGSLNTQFDFVRILIKKNGGFSTEGHSERSLHYGWKPDEHIYKQKMGRAIDFVVQIKNSKDSKWHQMPIIQQSLLLWKSFAGDDWGIGVYSWGNHLDYRHGVTDRAPSCWRLRMLTNEYIKYSKKDFYSLIEDYIQLNRPYSF